MEVGSVLVFLLSSTKVRRFRMLLRVAEFIASQHGRPLKILQ
jgi:hypothetical protein